MFFPSTTGSLICWMEAPESEQWLSHRFVLVWRKRDRSCYLSNIVECILSLLLITESISNFHHLQYILYFRLGQFHVKWALCYIYNSNQMQLFSWHAFFLRICCSFNCRCFLKNFAKYLYNTTVWFFMFCPKAVCSPELMQIEKWIQVYCSVIIRVLYPVP